MCRNYTYLYIIKRAIIRTNGVDRNGKQTSYTGLLFYWLVVNGPIIYLLMQNYDRVLHAFSVWSHHYRVCQHGRAIE